MMQSSAENIKEHNSVTITCNTEFQKSVTEKDYATNASTNEFVGDNTSVNEIKEVKCIDSLIEKKSLSLKNRDLKLNIQYQNPCLTCNTNEKSIIPTCIWYQDKNYIYLKLNILEIDKFNIESSTESIMFK